MYHRRAHGLVSLSVTSSLSPPQYLCLIAFIPLFHYSSPALSLSLSHFLYILFCHPLYIPLYIFFCFFLHLSNNIHTYRPFYVSSLLVLFISHPLQSPLQSAAFIYYENPIADISVCPRRGLTSHALAADPRQSHRSRMNPTRTLHLLADLTAMFIGHDHRRNVIHSGTVKHRETYVDDRECTRRCRISPLGRSTCVGQLMLSSTYSVQPALWMFCRQT